VLLTVTVCAALAEPTTVAPNVSAAGLTFSPDAVCAVPFSGTVTAVTPALLRRSPASLRCPAAMGLKITCTVQLAPAARDAVHVVVPVEKLDAAAPVIWKPTLAAATPPVLVMVNSIGVQPRQTSAWET